MITRRNFLGVMGGATLAVSFDAMKASGAQAGKPNFVFILSDDVNRDSWSVYGNKDCKTPNIARIAAEGMVFERAYCTVAMCAPFRQELYTGRTPWRTGTLANHSKSNPDTKSIVHYLGALGYRTGLLGKTHIGPKSVYPFEYLGDGGKKQDCNDLYMSETEKFIDSCEQEEKPFCLFIASHDGHSPYTTGDASLYPADNLTVPPYWYDTPQLRAMMSRYYAEVTNFDALVGRVHEHLSKRKLLDNTVVMVCTEQGTGMPFAKWSCFDNGLATGLVVRYPKLVKPGSRCGELASIGDITPTFVELAGGDPGKIDCDGRSLARLFRGETEAIHDYVYGAFTNCNIIDNRTRIYPIRAIRDKRYTLLYCPNHANITSNVTLSEALDIVIKDKDPETAESIAGSWAVKRKKDKRAAELVDRLFHRSEYALYDRDKDPCEEKNLMGDPEHKEVFERLKKQLHTRLKEHGDTDPIETEKRLCKHKDG